MKIALRSMANGRYVCADGAGHQPLIANRDAVGQWEEFEVIELEGSFPTPHPQPPSQQPEEPGPTPERSAAYVAKIKALLQAQGVDLSQACGAFQITKRVAWGLRTQGAGLLSKPGGNNCDGYATDIVLFDGGNVAFDILSDAGNTNGPIWSETGVDDGPGRFRFPVAP